MFQVFIQSVTTSLESLRTNKVRSFITMLGIIIGVSSVVVIMSIGAGAQKLIISQIETLGTNLLTISPGHSEEGEVMAAATNFSVTTLTYEDVNYLQDNKDAPHITAVTGYNLGFGSVKWRSQKYDTSLSGTTASYLDVEGGEIEEGRFFSEEEEKNLSRVAVLGSIVKEELFGESDAVSQCVKIGETSFEVIGIMKERGSVGFEDYDDKVFIPIKTSQRMMGINHIGQMRARVDSEENVSVAINNIKVVLREQHDIRDQSGKKDDFSINSSAQALEMITMITGGLQFFLVAMAALSLIVGGIGIMNIMLISVTERTKEIGLRKAIGANNFDILGQFILESVFITGIGGLIGVALGVIFSFLISLGIQLAGFDWEFVVPLSSFVLALVVSTSIGIFFGFYPAKKASELEPVTALQYE